MKHGTHSHPKMRELAERLGVPQSMAIGTLDSLWHFAMDYAPHGSLSKFTAEEISRAVYWPTEPARLVAGLIDSHWIDEDMFIHDWPSHCEDSVHMKLVRTRQNFACGCSPNPRRIAKGKRPNMAPTVCARHQECAHKQDVKSVRTSVRTPCAHNPKKVCAPPVPVPVPVPVPIPPPLRANGGNGNSGGVITPKKKETATATSPAPTQPRVRTHRPTAIDPTRNDSQPKHMDWVVHGHLVADRRLQEHEVAACEALVRGNVPWSAYTLGCVSDAIDARKAGKPMNNIWSYASGILNGDGPLSETTEKASHWIKALEQIALNLEAVLESGSVPPKRLEVIVKHWHKTHPAKAKAVGQVSDGPFD
jgi:hypothetical protein